MPDRAYRKESVMTGQETPGRKELRLYPPPPKGFDPILTACRGPEPWRRDAGPGLSEGECHDWTGNPRQERVAALPASAEGLRPVHRHQGGPEEARAAVAA